MCHEHFVFLQIAWFLIANNYWKITFKLGVCLVLENPTISIKPAGHVKFKIWAASWINSLKIQDLCHMNVKFYIFSSLNHTPIPNTTHCEVLNRPSVC